MRKRDVIILAINTHIRKTNHEYVIEIPTSVKYAYKIDKKNGNRFWVEALDKEIHNFGIAFEVL